MSDELKAGTGVSQEITRLPQWVEIWQPQLFRRLLWAVAGGGIAVLVFTIIISRTSADDATRLLPLVLGCFVVLTLLCLWLVGQASILGRDGTTIALIIFVPTLTAVLFVAAYFLNGVTGPVAPALISVPIIAGLVGGRPAARWVAFAVSVLYMIAAVLETTGLLPARQVTEPVLRYFYYGWLLSAVALCTYYVMTSTNVLQRALVVMQQRGQELVEATRRAEQAAEAERVSREREERTAARLRQAVREYSRFLTRISAGDHAARLEIEDLGDKVGDKAGDMAGEAKELVTLGRQLNATVETLVKALSDLQMVQRWYLDETYERFARSGVAHRGFRLENTGGGATLAGDGTGGVVADDAAWLAFMAQAVRGRSLVAEGDELALPLMLQGQVIGALGTRHGDGHSWSDEDVALVQAVADQLSQTIESLRLLDETQRRAAQEQLIGNVSARMRGTLNIESVLRTAVDEMYRVLDMDEIVIRLVAGQADLAGAGEKGNGDANVA